MLLDVWEAAERERLGELHFQAHLTEEALWVKHPESAIAERLMRRAAEAWDGKQAEEDEEEDLLSRREGATCGVAVGESMPCSGQRPDAGQPRPTAWENAKIQVEP